MVQMVLSRKILEKPLVWHPFCVVHHITFSSTLVLIFVLTSPRQPGRHCRIAKAVVGHLGFKIGKLCTSLQGFRKHLGFHSVFLTQN